MLLQETVSTSSAIDGGSATPGLVVPLRLRAGHDVLSFLSTTTVFGTPREVTLSEMAIESFYPADPSTRDLVRRL